MSDSISKLRDQCHLQSATIKTNIKVAGTVSVHDYWNCGGIYYRLLFSTRFGNDKGRSFSLIFFGDVDLLCLCYHVMSLFSMKYENASSLAMYCHYCASQENIFLA